MKFSFLLDETYFLLLVKLRQSHQPHRLAGRWHDEKDKEATFHIDARLFTCIVVCVGVYKYCTPKPRIKKQTLCIVDGSNPANFVNSKNIPGLEPI